MFDQHVPLRVCLRGSHWPICDQCTGTMAPELVRLAKLAEAYYNEAVEKEATEQSARDKARTAADALPF
jgi:hypothetical protein